MKVFFFLEQFDSYNRTFKLYQIQIWTFLTLLKTTETKSVLHYQRVSMTKTIHDVYWIFCFQVFLIMSDLWNGVTAQRRRKLFISSPFLKHIVVRKHFLNIFKTVCSCFVLFHIFVIDLTLQQLCSRNFFLFSRVRPY